MDYLNTSVISAKYIACTKYLATAVYILRFVPNFKYSYDSRFS